MFNYSTPQIGIVFALPPLMRFLMPFFFLKYFKLSRKSFYIGLAGTLIFSLLFYVTIDNFYLFVIPNMLLGVCLGLILPYIETFAMEHLQKERFGKSRLFGSIGFMVVGIVLAKNLQEPVNGLHYLFLTLIATVIYAHLIVHKNDHFNQTQEEEQASFSILGAKFFWISLFLMQVSLGAFYNFFTIYETDHGISLETTSYLWAFGVICEILLFYFQAPFLRRFSLIGLVKFSLLMTSIRWFLLFLFPSSLYISFFSQSLHAFSFALHHTAAFSILYSLYQNKKLAAQFYYGLSFGLGGFVGSLVAGYFYGEYLFLFESIIVLFALISISFFQGERIKFFK